VRLFRRIRELLYEQGFTISGARNKLDSRLSQDRDAAPARPALPGPDLNAAAIRDELQSILRLLTR